MIKEIIEIDQKALKFYVLLGELQNIADIIQTERFSFKNLNKLKEHTVVEKPVTNLKNTFREDLEKDIKDNNIAEQAVAH